MQWMFMLIGLVLGWLLDESFSDALLGALLGLVIGQTIRIARLGSLAAAQQQQLEQAKVALQGVEQRLFLLEGAPLHAAPPPTSAPAAEPVVEPLKAVEEAPAPELIWELPPELEPISAVASETSQPLPADVWRLDAVTPEPQTPAEPRGPNLVERGIRAARNWLFGGNTVLRVGVVLLFWELRFGWQTQRLARQLADQDLLPDDSDLPKRASGRVERDAADAHFETVKARVESAPDDWRGWYALAHAYDLAGDRKRARSAMRHAIALESGTPPG